MVGSTNGGTIDKSCISKLQLGANVSYESIQRIGIHRINKFKPFENGWINEWGNDGQELYNKLQLGANVSYESIHRIDKFKPFENGWIDEWGRMGKSCISKLQLGAIDKFKPFENGWINCPTRIHSV